MADCLPFGYASWSAAGLDTDFVLLDQRRFAMTWLSSSTMLDYLPPVIARRQSGHAEARPRRRRSNLLASL